MAAGCTQPLSQLANPANVLQLDWSLIDTEFNSILGPLHEALAAGLHTSEAAAIFADLLASHLTQHDVLQGPKPETQRNHRERSIIKLTRRLRELKNKERQSFRRRPKEFLNAVRIHHKSLKAAKRQEAAESGRRQERAFRENPWKFAKSVCNPSATADPSFSAQTALTYFQGSFSDADSTYTEFPDWIEDAMPPPDISSDFNMSPILPSTVKHALMKCSQSSSGEDGISYLHLRKMPCCHHFLATLYSKILLETQEAPAEWCSGVFKLIPKTSDSTRPENFRPIALTSTIGKLFHKILASRLEIFLKENGIIDVSQQKGFLSGINGTFEHIFSITAILENAKQHGLPLSVSFLDLRNAFGSVSHRLIIEMMNYIGLPPNLTAYVTDTYSKLRAYVKTRSWSTASFPIKKGIFQGDTLSPLLFLLVFNPVIKLCDKLQTTGFRLKLPILNSEGIPPVNAPIYLEWDVEGHDDPQGWYYAIVTQHFVDGRSQVTYSNGDTEDLNLNSVTWKLTRRGSKSYLPPLQSPPDYQLKKLREEASKTKHFHSEPHSAKAFADDLTVLSRNFKDHQIALRQVDSCCSDLGLALRPDKCVTLCFDGKKILRDARVQLSEGSTRNIASGATRFLGRTIDETMQSSCKESAERIRKKITGALKKIDERPIRGEYKVWIYKHYVATSVFFLLAVDAISESTIKSIQSGATRFIKKWLNLPRCATLASVFHPEVLNRPFLPQLRERAKLAFVSQVEATKDPLIKQALVVIQTPEYQQLQSIPTQCISVLEAAKRSVASINPKANLKKAAQSILKEHHAEQWSSTLDDLLVQSKFKDIISLEETNKTWTRLVTGLPSGQLSFILRAGMDCLPTPLNLKRWKYRSDPSCPLCGSSQATSLHILNGCPTALNQGRYTWRHDSVLNSIASVIKSEISPPTLLYADLPGYRASDNPQSTLPSDVSVSSARPDIVMREGNVIKISELTVCSNTQRGFDEARSRKRNKLAYTQLISDLEAKGFKVNYLTIEIGSLGHYTSSATNAISGLMPALSTARVKLMLATLGKVSIACSYHIFNARDSTVWTENRPLYIP